jgi:putative tryptophan/tyrosine transport system substrate-binding protein
VLAGIADSLARPGRNMTGISVMAIELNGKRLELLREIMPEIDRIAILASPTHAGEELERNNSVEMAQRLGIKVQYFPTPNTAELRRAYDSMAADPPQAIVVFPDPVTFSNRGQIVAFGSSQRIPVVSGWADFADAGALCTYGPKLAESYRAARLLCGPYSEWRKTCRTAGRAAHRIRTRRQPEDGQGARDRRAD